MVAFYHSAGRKVRRGGDMQHQGYSEGRTKVIFWGWNKHIQDHQLEFDSVVPVYSSEEGAFPKYSTCNGAPAAMLCSRYWLQLFLQTRAASIFISHLWLDLARTGSFAMLKKRREHKKDPDNQILGHFYLTLLIWEGHLPPLPIKH